MDYKFIIESKYNRQNWQLLLHDIFGKRANLQQQPFKVDTSSNLAKNALCLGKITLSDEQTIAVYEVELSDSVDIERNRRGIRDMLASAWRGIHAGAFMLCYRNNESVLRFSYVSESWTFAEDGTYQKESTDTKRFTYLLGEGHRSRTAIQQFEALRDSALSLKDITKAFSVEAVGDMFFKEYKKNYEDIIYYVTGKRMVKVANKWEEKQVGDPCDEIMSDFSHFANPEKAVRDYVKKLMGRLVFLQFLQKKGWLGVRAGEPWGTGDSEFIQNLFAQCNDKDHFVDNVLEALFNDLNSEDERKLPQYRTPYLNGGLFERDASDEANFPLPAKYLKHMLDFFSSYNFTIDENDPDDAEVGVDPEMLGRIFENLLEDNKDKGAFYTPKEIVTYMCRESLIAYLQTDIDDEANKEVIRKFVTNHDASGLGDLSNDIDQRLKDVKICDPAIGSGAFPMGLLKELFQCRTALEGISQHQAAEIKKHIIQNNIYGVDIEKGAVDIARLRFWLSLIVDEETPQALPNLDFKIMRGNSLLEQYNGFDLSTIMQSKKKVEGPVQMSFFEDDVDVLRRQVIGLRRTYYRETNKQKKKNLRQQMRDIVQQQINTLSYKVDLSGIDIADNSDFFLWHTWFADVFESGGFDIMIGNPPYVGEKGHKELFQPVKLDSHLGQFYLGKMDYFYFFFHLAINNMHDKGKCIFITTNYYPTALGAKKLRQDFIERTNILQLINFNEYRIFESALGQHNLITMIEKSSIHNKDCMVLNTSRKGYVRNEHIQTILYGSDESVKIRFVPQSYLYEGEDHYIRLTAEVGENSQLSSIFRKMVTNCKTLGEICQIANGVHTEADYLSNKKYDLRDNKAKRVKDGIYVLDNSNEEDLFVLSTFSNDEMQYLKPFFKNSDIGKFYTNTETKKSLIYINKQYDNIDLLPNIHKHLLDFKTIIDKSSDNSPYLHRPKRKQSFVSPKIVCSQRSKSNNFGYNEIAWYASADVYFITEPKEGFTLKYLLGLLNSQLYYVWLYNKGKRKGESLELYQKPLSEIPIREISVSQQKTIINHVDAIIAKKNKNHDANTLAEERAIDILVFKLYNLTYDEVLVVDPQTTITKEEYESNSN